MKEINLDYLHGPILESDLQEIELDSLKDFLLSPGHLFFKTKFSGAVSLLRAGDFIGEEFINKFKKRNVSVLHSYQVLNNDEFSFLIGSLNEIKETFEEDKKNITRENLLSWFQNKFMAPNAKASMLDLVIAFQEVFLKKDKSKFNLYYDQSHVITQRGFISATLVTLTAIFDAYLDYDFLRELFLTTLYLNLGLLYSKEINYEHIISFEKERMARGAGLVHLQRFLQDQNLFKLSGTKSENALVGDFGKTFKDINLYSLVSLIDLLKKKKDKSNKHISSLLDYQFIILYFERLIPFEEFIFERMDSRKVMSFTYQGETDHSSFLRIQNYLRLAS